MLGNHLERIALLLPPEKLEKMQKLEFWVENDNPTLKGMQYHPGKDWLIENGHDPRLVKMVHIPQAAKLYSRQQMLKHPAVILHELAHSYHDQVLGFDDAAIIAAYDDAMEKKIYDKSLLFTGEIVKHYGATNHKEYFAESTEAYFYHNDFYPFVRAELKQHDPKAFAEMERVWGKVQ
jgi:dipeptidyl-peptidase-4